MRKLFVLLAVLSTVLVLSTREAHALFRKNTTPLWGTPELGATVPVCYTATLAQQPNFATFLSAARNALGQTWERAANITFTGWQQCPAPPFPPATVVLEYQACAFNAYIGKSSQFANVFILDFNCNVPGNDNSYPQRWAYLVGHEFGHILGFEHEQDRYDNPFYSGSGGCGSGAANPALQANEITETTPYDAASVMNYCGANGNLGRSDVSLGGWIAPLSSWDNIGAILTYGKKRNYSIIGLNGRALTAGGFYTLQPAGSSPSMQFWGRDQNQFFHPVPDEYFSIGLDPWGRLENAEYMYGTEFTVRAQWIMMGDKCVGADSANAQTWLTIGTCGTRSYETWTWDRSTSRLVLSGTNMCVNIPFGDASVGNHVQIYPCQDPVGTNEQFTFNAYDIQYGGLCFNVVGGLPNDGSWIQLYPCSPNHDYNDVYHFRGKIIAEPYCMESVPSDTTVQMAACVQEAEQTWDLWP